MMEWGMTEWEGGVGLRPSSWNKVRDEQMKFDSVTDDHIVTLVDRFYDRIREDAELGPVFEESWPVTGTST